MTDIISLGCEHLQTRNKLKGIAMQKIILTTIINKKEDISLSNILKIVSTKTKDYYLLENPFKINTHLFSFKNEFIHSSEFPDKLKIYIKLIEDKKWKKCSYCGQVILTAKQNSSKCRKCKKGYFRYLENPFTRWTLTFDGDKNEGIKKLIKEGYLKKVNKLTKRADFFYYSEGIFYIYESKNKEISGLTFKDVFTSLIYPIILKRCGYNITELKIIFNGGWTEDLEHQIQKGYAEKFNFKISFYPIKQYLTDNNIFIKEVIISYEAGKYNYVFVNGKSEQTKIIIKSYKPTKKKKEHFLKEM